MSLLKTIFGAGKANAPPAPEKHWAESTLAGQGIETTATDREAILKSIDALLGPRMEGGWLTLPERIGFKAETLAAILGDVPEAKATPADLAQLRALEKQWVDGYTALCKFTDAAARERWRQEQAALAEKLSQGKPLDADDGWSVENWADDYRSKSQAGRVAMNAAGLGAWKVLTPLLPRVIDAARKVAADRLVSEYRRYQALHIPFEPSRLNRTLAGLVSHLTLMQKTWQDQGTVGRPSDSAAQIGITL